MKIINERRAARAMAQRKLERESLSSGASTPKRESFLSASKRYSLIDGKAVMRSSLAIRDPSSEYVINDDRCDNTREDRPAPIPKESVKLNVESINDRFISSLLGQERIGRDGRLANIFPPPIKSPNVRVRPNPRKGSLKPMTDARRQIPFPEEYIVKSSQFSFDFNR
jgi:hypothetical protein